MKRLIGCCLLVLGVMVGGARTQTVPATGPATGPDAIDPVVMKEIGELRNGIVEALNKGDMEKVLTYLDKDIVVTWANAEVSHGPAGVKAYTDKMLSGPNKIVESMKVNPVVEGRKLYGDNMMISYGSLGDEFKLTDGRSFSLNSRFSSLLVKENGKWTMKGFHASANVFDNPVQTIVAKKAGLWAGIIGGVVGLLIGFVVARMFRRKSAV